jgi:hypothetical protein
MIKAAAPSDLPVVERIMDYIHKEDPSYWPYGLSAQQFNGGLYLVKKSSSDAPVGFVGWQKFAESGRDVGYYAIGIMPEYRQQGFAKQAVTQVLREIGNQCHEVKAMVMTHNQPSKALARSLSIPMIEKLAMEKEATTGKAQALHAALGALGSAAFFDQTANPDRTIASTFKPWEWDKERLQMGGLNALLGGLGGQQVGQALTVPGKSKALYGGLTSIAMAPTKDLALKGVGTLHNVDAAAKKFAETGGGGISNIPPAALLGAGGLGLGALALLAYSAKRKADHRDDSLALQSKGRVKITLPTKAPGDNETEVELPFDDLNLSQALRGRLGRDTRRRLYSETKQRTVRRKPKDPSKPTEKELEDLALVQEEEELDKAATMSERLQDLVSELGFYKSAAAAPQSSVPTPPQLGQNPAMRMSQQDQAVANSIQPSTDANPQIMKAQQAAMEAEQAGAQRMAQMEQANQQAQMQQQQQFQEAMAKSEQEKDVLKLQLEKEKALSELSAAQSKAQAGAQAAAGKGEGTAAQKLLSNRLARLGKRVKSANVTPATAPATPAAATNPVPTGTPGTTDPNTGQIVPEAPIYLKPQTAQLYNTHAQSTGMMATPTVARHSYGGIGDMAYDMLLRQRMLTPDAPKAGMFSRSSALNTPDKMGLALGLMGGAYDTYAGMQNQPTMTIPGMLDGLS